MAAFLDACRFIPTTGGTTDWTYASAVGGCQSPTAANATNGTVYKFLAVSNDLTQWEIAEGAYSSSGAGTLARTTVLYNSAGTGTKTPGQSGGGTKINFSTVPQVAVIGIKEDLISVEEANSFTTTQQQQARSNIGMPVGQIPGTTGTTQPSAGNIGERIASSGSTPTLSSNVYANAASVTLTPGIWDIDAYLSFGGPGAVVSYNYVLEIGTSSAGSTGAISTVTQRIGASSPSGDMSIFMAMPRQRVTVSASTTYYLNAQATITSGSGYVASGVISGTRVS